MSPPRSRARARRPSARRERRGPPARAPRRAPRAAAGMASSRRATDTSSARSSRRPRSRLSASAWAYTWAIQRTSTVTRRRPRAAPCPSPCRGPSGHGRHHDDRAVDGSGDPAGGPEEQPLQLDPGSSTRFCPLLPPRACRAFVRRPRLSGRDDVPRWFSKRVMLGVAGAVLIVATFAYFLPKIADYRDVWGVVKERVVGVDAGARGGYRDQPSDLRAAVARAPSRPALLAGADDDPGDHRAFDRRAGRSGGRDRDRLRDVAARGLRAECRRSIGDAGEPLEPARQPGLSDRGALPVDDGRRGDGGARDRGVRRRGDPGRRRRCARARPLQQPHGRGDR